MNRPTLSTIRNGRLPALIGECAGNLNTLRALVNSAQERLLHDPLAPEEGWFGSAATMAFNMNASDRRAYLTTPRDVARIIGVNVASTPVPIRNGFYEYLTFERGLRDVASCCQGQCSPLEAFERDNVATIAPLSGNRKVHVYYSDDADLGQRVIIQGLDANGIQVTETDDSTMRAKLGESVYITAPFVSTVNTFSTITGIMKGPTLGGITFEQYDEASAISTPLSYMEPGETTGYYRRYLLSGLAGQNCYSAGSQQVTASVKLDLVPAMVDQDYLLIQNPEAIIEECMSIRYGGMDSAESSAKAQEHHAMALRLLFGQLDHHYGKTNTSISVKIFGSARLQRQPR